MWELWFLGTHGQWEYVDHFDHYNELVEHCNQLQAYAKVVLQVNSGNHSACLANGYSGTARTVVNLSLLSPNVLMHGHYGEEKPNEAP